MNTSENEPIATPAGVGEPGSSTAAAAAPIANPPQPTVESLQAEVAALKSQNRELLAEKEAESAEEILISQKMKAGLSRAQAMAVIRNQARFDASDYGKAMRARHNAAQRRNAQTLARQAGDASDHAAQARAARA
jgi:hypothetical protein